MARFSKALNTLALTAALVGGMQGLSAGAGCAQQASVSGQTQKPLNQEKIEQLVAPIALYPDALLSHVLMASTYPLEIVQAARWTSSNASVKGKALEEALSTQTWDPSVKSLVAFPSVLKMMNEKLNWTQQLGDAFLAQQKAVMTAVQTLRLRAEKAGQLKSTKEQKVSKTTSGNVTYIVIEPQSPSVVYVPVYNPTIVYGVWPYPAYPPYYYYPPGYIAGNAFWFGVGIAAGSALWGGCHWGRNEININISHYNKFNRTNISQTTWRHDVTHRQGVPYSNPEVAREFRPHARDHEQREQFRGRLNDARSDLNRPSDRPSSQDRDRPRTDVSNSKRDETRQSRDRQPSAFDRVGSGREVRSNSARGKASRSSFEAPSERRGGGGRRTGGRG